LDFYNQKLNPLAASWQPPAPQQQLLFSPAEAIVEVNILSDTAGPTLRSAIELVSPANKDRPEHRQAFLAKCETFLRQGISLVVVDVVANRKATLYRELLNSLVSKL
jgi:phosphatidate phosphatase APP1